MTIRLSNICSIDASRLWKCAYYADARKNSQNTPYAKTYPYQIFITLYVLNWKSSLTVLCIVLWIAPSSSRLTPQRNIISQNALLWPTLISSYFYPHNHNLIILFLFITKSFLQKVGKSNKINLFFILYFVKPAAENKILFLATLHEFPYSLFWFESPWHKQDLFTYLFIYYWLILLWSVCCFIENINFF